MKTLAIVAVLIAVLATSWRLRSSPNTAPESVLDPRDYVRTPPAIPAGVYYLLEYISVPTQKGAVGWTPGEALRLNEPVDASASYVQVTDGKNLAWIPLSYLTADEVYARRVQQADENIEMSAQTYTEAMAGWSNAQTAAHDATAARNIEQANADQVASSTIGSYSSRLRHGAYLSTDPMGYYSYYEVLPVYPTANSLPASAAPVFRANDPANVYVRPRTSSSDPSSTPSTRAPRLGGATETRFRTVTAGTAIRRAVLTPITSPGFVDEKVQQ